MASSSRAWTTVSICFWISWLREGNNPVEGVVASNGDDEDGNNVNDGETRVAEVAALEEAVALDSE